MKKKPLICVLLFIGLAACKNNEDTLRFKALNEGLKKYGDVIKGNNEKIDYELKEKLHNPQTASKAAIWQPKVAYIKASADSMTAYIEALKAELKKETGLNENDEEPAGERNRDAVNRMFKTNSGADTLYNKLMAYNEKVLSVLNFDEFSDNPVLMADIKKNKEAFRQQLPVSRETPVAAYFRNASAAAAFALLTRLQNDVLLTGYELMDFCRSQIGVLDGGGFQVFSAIAAQNTTFLKSGELLEITAGVGSFSVAARPKITIDGKNIPLDPDGTAIYRIKAPGKPGKHVIPVKIEFVKPDGSLAFVTKKIEYTVAE